MIHYTCDRCRRAIRPERDVRYVVSVQIHAAIDPREDEQWEDDRDHLSELDELLQQAAEQEDEAACDPPPLCQQRRYDLCPDCYRKYLKNPLGRETPAPVGFSPN